MFKLEKYGGIVQFMYCANLQNMSSNLFQWFNENELKGNASKYDLLLSSDEYMNANGDVHHRLKIANTKGYLGLIQIVIWVMKIILTKYVQRQEQKSRSQQG